MSASKYDGIPDDDIWSVEYSELSFTAEIARGSFGKIFRGQYLGMDVAIKQILRHDDPAYLKYIEREISVLKGVRHPFIVGFTGVCLHHSGLYIVTEFVSGGDVRALLKAGNVSWKKRVQIAGDLAKAMFYLHSKKIIHRDLKAKNLLIGADQRVRVCDFGFARTSEFQGQRPMTICGTPGFVAPEIMQGMDYDAACDVFSYGNVLAELITLQRPGKDFWIRTADDSFQMNLEEMRTLAKKDCPPLFLELCLLCCAFNPEERPDFGFVVKAIKEIEQAVSDEPEPKAEATSARSGTVSGSKEESNVTHEKGTPVDQVPVSYLKTVRQLAELQLSSGDNATSEKHLRKMVTRAINPDFFDSEYLQDLLFTYPCFASPQDIMNILIERYTSTALESFNLGNLKDVDVASKKQQLVGIRIIVFLNTWIEKYPEDFEEPEMIELVQAFDVLAANSESKDTFSIQNTIAKNRIKKPTFSDTRTLGEAKLLDPSQMFISGNELGRQITFKQFEMYKKIQTREFLKETWKSRPDSSIKRLQEQSKQFSRWVATAIVCTNTIENRAALISKFVEAAQQCLNLKNFCGLFSILGGLNHQSVERLSQTWLKVNSHVITTLKSFDQLSSKDGYYRNYKAKQEASLAPSIPFLDVYLEEIAFVDSFNQDIGKGGIINFSKHRKIARIVRYLEGLKSKGYSEIQVVAVHQTFLNSQALDDDALSKRSLNCERPISFG